MIPIFNLTRQYGKIRKDIDVAVTLVHKKGNYILGGEVAAFEKEFARFIGVPYAVGVASGTDALTLSIRALTLSKDDEVIVPANAYPTFFGVALSGVIVRLADCGGDGNIDPEDLRKRITERTKGIVVVHLYGNPCDVIGIQKVLKDMQRHDISIIEDCAQAHGATIGKKKVGTFGNVAVFSFYPSKNLGAYGDGGMVVTRTKKIADRVRMLRMYGEINRYESLEVSGVSRLDELQAAILLVKLRHLNAWNRRRKEIALVYASGLSGISELIVLPFGEGAVHHVFVIRTKKRDALKEYLAKKGIGTAIHYPKPLHSTAALTSLGYRRGAFPVAERLSKEILSLPIYPELTESEVHTVIRAVRSFFTSSHQV